MVDTIVLLDISGNCQQDTRLKAKPHALLSNLYIHKKQFTDGLYHYPNILHIECRQLLFNCVSSYIKFLGPINTIKYDQVVVIL